MDTRHVYCPGCNHKVRLVMTEGHLEGQANLPQGAEVVCLDFGEGCSEGVCPLTSRPGVVMGVRLARSHLRDEAFRTIHGECASCGQLAGLEMIDDEHAVCPLCNSTNTYLVVDLDGEWAVAVTGA
jgi:DNA-directed RNA polymerase subunit RPC12/RpoP